MKIATETNHVESHGVVSKIQFGIQASPEAFAMLSSGIYENKIAAPIRELGTNALDAHIAAGCPDKPFKVWLPNDMNPEFRIRDYGTGLSLKQMIGEPEKGITGIYNTYMASNKKHSNDFTGCFGIGSKSPWTYTDGFNVTSYYNGTKYHFACVINENRMPEINYFGESETDEPNGLEVSFAVKQEDISKFVNESKNVYRFFRVKPEIEGHDGWVANTPTYSYKFDGFGMRQNGSGGSVAIMGSVGYRIDPRHFSGAYSQLLNMPLDFSFDMGEVKMTASREGLEYTPQVVSVIKQRCDKAFEQLEKFINDKLSSAKTIWEKMLLFQTIKNDFAAIIEALKLANKLTTIKSVIKLRDHGFVGGETVSFSEYGSSRRTVTEINVSKTTKFIFESVPEPGNFGKCMHHAITNKCSVFFFKSTNAPALNKLVSEIGLPVVNVTTLPKPPKAQRSPVNSEFFDARKIRYTYSYKQAVTERNSYNVKDIGPNDKFLVFTSSEIDSEYYQDTGVIAKGRILKFYSINEVFGSSCSTSTIYLVNKTTATRLKKKFGNKYQDYVVWAKQQVEELVQKKGYYVFANSEKIEKLLKLASIVSREKPNILADLLTFKDDYSKLGGSPSAEINTLMGYFDIKINTNQAMDDSAKALYEKYEDALLQLRHIEGYEYRRRFYLNSLEAMEKVNFFK